MKNLLARVLSGRARSLTLDLTMRPVMTIRLSSAAMKLARALPVSTGLIEGSFDAAIRESQFGAEAVQFDLLGKTDHFGHC
jgi:hypothetical protein